MLTKQAHVSLGTSFKLRILFKHDYQPTNAFSKDRWVPQITTSSKEPGQHWQLVPCVVLYN